MMETSLHREKVRAWTLNSGRPNHNHVICWSVDHNFHNFACHVNLPFCFGHVFLSFMVYRFACKQVIMRYFLPTIQYSKLYKKISLEVMALWTLWQAMFNFFLYCVTCGGELCMRVCLDFQKSVCFLKGKFKGSNSYCLSGPAILCFKQIARQILIVIVSLFTSLTIIQDILLVRCFSVMKLVTFTPPLSRGAFHAILMHFPPFSNLTLPWGAWFRTIWANRTSSVTQNCAVMMKPL